MELKYDAVIVGGGPIGGFIAEKLAEKNIQVAVFEQHTEIGVPLRCAGLVTSRVFQLINKPMDEIIQNTIKGAHIHSPSGHILSIGGDKKHALVIDRTAFDKTLMRHAEKKGAQVFLKNKVLSAQNNQGIIELITSQKHDVSCKLLIGADGPFSKTRDLFGMPQPKEFLRGMGAEITDVSLDPDFVEIFIGNSIAPGFFAWIIPTNPQGTQARVGVCIGKNTSFPPKHYFEQLFSHPLSQPYLEKATITCKIGGVIPLGPLEKTFESHVLLVGDAAAQVKPTSGGGIYPGLVCAAHCAAIATEAFNKNMFSPQQLKKYHLAWSKEIGRELSLGMKFRKIFTHLTDDQMDKFIKKFQNTAIVEIISRYGDIDFPSKLMKPLMKKLPSLITLLPHMLK